MIVRGVLTSVICLGAGQSEDPGEYEAKAAHLYNFALYVEWPAAALEGRATFEVGTVGRDVFGGALEKAVGERRAQGRPVELRRFAVPEDVKPVPILFVPAGEGENLTKISALLKGSGTLIVGESEGAARKGAAIGFFLEGRRVRIEVNADAAAREGLRVGAKVLRMARVVKDT